MNDNVLVTGPPRSGKTTVIAQVAEQLTERGLTIGGVVCPEIRRDGQRWGFAIVDYLSGERAVMASVEREHGPQVGKYRVDAPAIDAISAPAFRGARTTADICVIDEIAPMEMCSDEFIDGTRTLLDSSIPVLAAIHYRSQEGFIGAVKSRSDMTYISLKDVSSTDLIDRLVQQFAPTT